MVSSHAHVAFLWDMFASGQSETFTEARDARRDQPSDGFQVPGGVIPAA